MTFLLSLALLLAALWAFARFRLAGSDLSHLDQPLPTAINAGEPPSAALDQVHAQLAEMSASGGSFSGAGMASLRARMDELGDAVDTSGFSIDTVSAGGVPAEWVRAAQSDPDRRVLYLHGGAFTVGSPRSHRRVTTELARRLKASVLAVDYRLMPEHPRQAGIEDCRAAYRYITDQGPELTGAPRDLWVAGDSAGGSLTLNVIAWARNEGLPAASGAIALSPTTDASFSAASFKANVDSDRMLGPLLKPVLRVPRPIALWMTWLTNRTLPTDPSISPLRGDLSGLPPILVQASTAEMLLDDGARYVVKAKAAGTDATLELWDHMVHVWQIFAPALPEANAAFDRMEAFAARTEKGGSDATEAAPEAAA